MSILLNPANDWKSFGTVDPYYGVISNDRFKTSSLTAEALDDFFSSGVVHVEKVLDVAKQVFAFTPHGRALDFGCGVGRLTNALCPHFDTVVGLDISAGMLARAREDSASRGVGNVSYAPSTDRAWLAPGTYDFVHSYIVLQHIPTTVGETIIRDLVTATKPGGVGAIHFTYGYAQRPFVSTVKNSIKRVPLLRNVGNLLSGRRLTDPAMQMNCYSIAKVIEILALCGVDRFHAVRVDDWGNLGLIVFFEKSHGYPTWSNPKPVV